MMKKPKFFYHNEARPQKTQITKYKRTDEIDDNPTAKKWLSSRPWEETAEESII